MVREPASVGGVDRFASRVVSAVYEMMGTESSNMSKAQELFSKMDQNSDGLVSQEEFIAVW